MSAQIAVQRIGQPKGHVFRDARGRFAHKPDDTHEVTRAEIEDAIAHRLEYGRNPAGYRVRITEWRGREVSSDQQTDFFHALKNFADRADFDVSDASPIESDGQLDWESEDDEQE